ncbi:MAG: DNA recombination protein RmuC [Lachnospiraceae bacterium]|nr:DNA recombination protein RmuC [Lachnospiraceae bacterium]
MTVTWTTILLILILLMMLAILVILVVLLARTGAGARSDQTEELLEDLRQTGLQMLDDTEDNLTDRISLNVAEIRQDINARLVHDSEENRRNRVEVSDMLARSQDKLERSLKLALFEMQEFNKQNITDIQAEINRKLDTSLNERLDASFRTVGEQLNRLYVSLGELSKLESGVSSLNRTLSNVKTRGIYGEMQLENILADILAPSLYDRNVVTKRSEGANREAVEFAVKIPDKEAPGEFMYLPIDSKFPDSAYSRIMKAAERADAEEMQRGMRELEQRVRTDAKDIRDKYLDPPHTTDFGIMFLPTESLYAEVLRIPGLAEDCRTRYHVVLSGPTTLAALLNSLSIGFRYMAVNKDSRNILKLLAAIKSQYATLSKLIETAGTRIDLARKATDDLQRRADLINKKLSDVEELDPVESQSLLDGAKL